jgi:putative hydrolase of the HAD superfamily
MKTAIVSNCSSEEVKVLKESEIYKYFDEVILSYEVHMKKPDSCIYEEAAKRLGIDVREYIFVGDGGSSELVGARKVGMKAIQAKWYTNKHPQKRENIEDFQVAEEPLDIIMCVE